MASHEKHKDLAPAESLKAPVGARKIRPAVERLFVFMVANNSEGLS